MQTPDAIFQRDEFRCVYCGNPFERDRLTIDHVEPRMRGGDRSAGNLVTSCKECNRAKGGQAAWRYLAGRPEQRENFLRYATSVWPRLRRAIEQAAQLNNPSRRPKL
jgi:5-methylcytosine-specific restriction endonuclease McrA